MFENLSDRLQQTFRSLTGRGALTEKNIDDAMREVRRALLEADVNYDIVKEFVAQVSEECLGEQVLKSVTPGQQAVKVVNDRLTALMGEANEPLALTGSPAVIMIVGLHGGGKTTTTAKLTNHLKRQDRLPLMVALDVHRPAAIDQLEVLGREIDVPVFSDRSSTDVTAIAKAALVHASKTNRDTVILDTAGRLQIDDDLVQELVKVRGAVSPDEILLVADAALGQEAVSVATHFNDALALSGIVLTKLDGDARGGAALSMRQVTGRPIKFIGVGEKIQDLEPFYPERMASRILGMGDVVSLVEKAAESISEEEARALEQKMLQNKFDLNDFLGQLQQLKNLGGLASILDMMPGGRQLKEAVDENSLTRVEAILQSMTSHEREHPEVLTTQSRRRRIAQGCGQPLDEVQQMLKRFEMMRDVMGNKGKMSKLMNAFGGGMGDLAGALGGGGAGAGFGGGMGGLGGMMPGSLGGGTKKAKIVSQKAKKARRNKHKRKRR